MEARYIEPRKVIWATAEISWADAGGVARETRATIQDISASGACLRVRSPIEIGARLRVKWRREQFSAVARNCRREGMEYLLGVRREADAGDRGSVHVVKAAAAHHPSTTAQPPPVDLPLRAPHAGHCGPADILREEIVSKGPTKTSADERNVMEPKQLFSPFWRRAPEVIAPEVSVHMEAPMKPAKDLAGDPAIGRNNDLLSYEDIYHAAGLVGSRSGYGIPKVSEMLNSERIRDLSKDIKRASVLMALDVAGVATEELLQDAQRRQHALNSYEDGQRKQLEEFETRKTQENARLQAEMERVAAHYGERIQRNRDQVAREKEALHNWQMAKQHEMQRIGEVIEVCSRQPAAMGMAAGVSAGADAGRPILGPEGANRG